MTDGTKPRGSWVDEVVTTLVEAKAGRDKEREAAVAAANRLQSARRAAWNQIILPGLRRAVERLNENIPKAAEMKDDTSNSAQPTVGIKVKFGRAEGSATFRADIIKGTVEAVYSIAKRDDRPSIRRRGPFHLWARLMDPFQSRT